MANDLSSLLAGGIVLEPQAANSRKHVLSLVSDALGEKLGIDGRDILEAVIERENLGSTAVGEGVVIPHARVDKLAAPVGGFLRLTEGIDFDAPDGRPCDLVFVLLAPHISGADHLRALAQVSRAFRVASFRENIRDAETLEDLHSVLCPESAMSISAA